MQSIPARRIRLRSSGKMPTTSVRRPISLLKRSSGFVRPQLAPVRARERVEGQDVGLGVLEHRRDLGQPPVEMRDRFREPVARLGERVGVEDRADQRAQQPVLVLAGVAEAVAQEVHGAALPGAAEDLGDRGLQPGVRVADRELDADQAARDQAAEELGPERLGLGLADVDGEDLAPAGLVDAVGDHQRLVDHAAAVADLLDLGVEEQVRVAALQRPRPERLDVLIERLADAADLALADPQPEALDELVDAPGRDAADIGLLDHRQQRLLRAPARLQECSGSSCPGGSWGSAARSPPRACPTAAADTRCDASPDPRGRRSPRSAPINSDTSSSIISARDRLDRLADHIGVLVEQHLPDDLLDRHPVGTGHAAPPFVEP